MSVAYGKDYVWPTDASRVITSSFGEYRTGHIHAGIDIKTWGQAGYQIFAIDSGSVVHVRVSPYGYGRALYFRLDNGWTAIYAHLSRYNDTIEKLIREEQKSRGQFTVEKYFRPGTIRVKKGDLLGYTGSSGVGFPHLHFEIRDDENHPLNPFLLGYTIDDQVPPLLKSMVVSPLDGNSHVDGDFRPKIYYPRLIKKGSYRFNSPILCWGRIGLALSAFDISDGAENRFAIYKVWLIVDDQLVFTERYNRFDYDKTRQVDVDRDYRLFRWGWGLFQKLYKDEGNTLPFYEPNLRETGVIVCGSGVDSAAEEQNLSARMDVGKGGSVRLSGGIHSFRIEASDFAGNVSQAVGELRMISLPEMHFDTRFNTNGGSEGFPQNAKISIEKSIFDGYVRFCVRSNVSLGDVPRLNIRTQGDVRIPVHLTPKNSRQFIGTLVLDERIDGNAVIEVQYRSASGLEQTHDEAMELFMVRPREGGSIASADQKCRVIFPPGSVYRPIWGRIQKDRMTAGFDLHYSFFPNDIPLKEKILVLMDADVGSEEKEKLGVYIQGKNNHAIFIGNEQQQGVLSAWTDQLNSYAVRKDTTPPVIFSLRPRSGTHLSNRMPHISVRFRDHLSGIYGEDCYIVRLDGVRLVVEYDPEADIAFHQIESPLSVGEHVLDVTARDRAGNVAVRQSRFYIDSQQR